MQLNFLKIEIVVANNSDCFCCIDQVGKSCKLRTAAPRTPPGGDKRGAPDLQPLSALEVWEKLKLFWQSRKLFVMMAITLLAHLGICVDSILGFVAENGVMPGFLRR